VLLRGPNDVDRRWAPLPYHVAGVAIRKGNRFPRVVPVIDAPPSDRTASLLFPQSSLRVIKTEEAFHLSIDA
jgi:hypothetical protein